MAYICPVIKHSEYQNFIQMRLHFYILLGSIIFSFSSCSQLKQPKLNAYALSVEKHRTSIHKDMLSEEHPFNKEQKSKFIGFDYFPANESFKTIAELKFKKETEAINMVTSDGKTRKYLDVANLQFELQNQTYTLHLYQSIDGNHYFLPFTDETNGVSSYGGGRYLDIESQSIKGNTLELDFNLCYNPYCAFVEGYSCPIPPRNNHLNIKLEAGVKYQKTVFTDK